MQGRKIQRRAVVKAAFLVMLVVLATIIFRFTPAKECLSPERLRNFLAAAGSWGPLAFILLYGVGICLFIPGGFLTTLGATLFGAYWGFLYNWLGAMLGASAAFFIARYLGREFASSLIGDRLKKYDDAIAKHGFATVLYLRLIFFPFTLLDFGMGLTKVRFGDYFWGTGLGIIVGTFIISFLVGRLMEAWVSGQWGRLLSWEFFFIVGLLIFSLFIPKILKKFQVERMLKNS
jgi:uncharacterized membrane protein YdjX (TVP38/TMEM64 family)